MGRPRRERRRDLLNRFEQQRSLIAEIWKPLGTYSPAALATQPASLAAGKDVAVLWPVLTSLLLAAVFVALATLAFRRRDL
jgi:ABC-2 type transport system permease protein